MLDINDLKAPVRHMRRYGVTTARQILPEAAKTAAVAAALCIVSAVVPGVVRSADLVPHTAYYSLALRDGAAGGNIKSAGGDLAIRLSADCAGWTVDNHMTLDAAYSTGQAVRLGTEATTWEARDGSRYNFSMRTLVNGQEAPRIEGHAISDGVRSRAVFSSPPRPEVPLSAATVFPLAHTQKILAAAAKGRRIVTMQVFDGFSSTESSLVNVVIGMPGPVKVKPGSPAAISTDIPAWTFGFAIFADESKGAEPAMEWNTQVYANGVMGWADIIIAGFVIRAELKKLALDDLPDCKP